MTLIATTETAQAAPPGRTAGSRPTPPLPEGPRPLALGEVATRVDGRLRALLATERAELSRLDPDLDAPLAALERAVLAGGKRLRPGFAHWGWCAAGGDPAEDLPLAVVDDLGAALELLHAFALVHDDVMDDADRRRGVPTTHAAFARHHADAGWRGEGRRFGESVAILVGDLAHTYADGLVAGASARTRWLWRQLQVELVAGQYLDVACTAAGHADEARARRIARLKSGRYTIEQPLRLGASLRDRHRTPEEIADLDAALEAFGAPLGMAFQLRDDVLGAVGDPAVTGKPVGDDLRTGKPTALLAMARAAADPAQRRLLDRVGDPDLGDADVAALQQVLLDTGALAELQDEIDDLVGASMLALEQGPFPSATAEALADVAAFVVGRDH